MSEDTPKEFWIASMFDDLNLTEDIICIEEYKTSNFDATFTHVIEYSAYEQLKAENEKLRDEQAKLLTAHDDLNLDIEWNILQINDLKSQLESTDKDVKQKIADLENKIKSMINNGGEQ